MRRIGVLMNRIATDADARMDKAPTEPNEVDAIIDYLLRIRDAN
jgi:hypothetical protein